MGLKFEGNIWKLRDDVDTDIIIPTQYIVLFDVERMSAHAFEPLRPELPSVIQEGDVIVAGKNFGCGSSREIAPEIIKYLGVSCIIAKSFARIFYRNAVNNGMLLIESDLYDRCEEGDRVKIDTDTGIEYNGSVEPISPIPPNIAEIIEAGGLVKMMKKRNGLEV